MFAFYIDMQVDQVGCETAQRRGLNDMGVGAVDDFAVNGGKVGRQFEHAAFEGK